MNAARAVEGCDAAFPRLLPMTRRPFPIRYAFQPSGAASGAPSRWRSRVAQAMRQWERASPRVAFVEHAPSSAEAPDLLIGWFDADSDPCRQFGRGSRVAHTGYLTPELVLHFDGSVEWTGERFDRTVLHELGHVLGLDHDADPRAVLFADERPNAAPELHALDVLALASVVGDESPLQPGDLVLRSDGSDAVPLAILRGIAPPDCADVALFDGDGDGRAELFIAYRAGNRRGALHRLSFDDAGALRASDGPLYGLTSETAEHVYFEREGERFLALRLSDGSIRLRRFDASGLPTRPVLPPGSPAMAGTTGSSSAHDARPVDADAPDAILDPVALGREVFAERPDGPPRGDVNGDGVEELLELVGTGR